LALPRQRWFPARGRHAKAFAGTCAPPGPLFAFLRFRARVDRSTSMSADSHRAPRAVFVFVTKRTLAKRWLLAGAALVATSLFTWAFVGNPTLVARLHQPLGVHADQGRLVSFVVNNNPSQAFLTAFDEGDQLFDTRYTAADGGGANVGQGQRYTR